MPTFSAEPPETTPAVYATPPGASNANQSMSAPVDGSWQMARVSVPPTAIGAAVSIEPASKASGAQRSATACAGTAQASADSSRWSR